MTRIQNILNAIKNFADKKILGRVSGNLPG
jgi:hypothetical protein